MRMLDRLRGPDPPRIIAVDPRLTPVAREADVHLPVKSGTNLVLVNGPVRELIHNGWVDERYVREHTLGFERLRETVEPYTVERVAEICEVRQEDVREAARIVGTAERLLSTVLQGVYQSNQATASACGVNNIHLLRGMLGRPGAGVLQMNGQPTAQKHARDGVSNNACSGGWELWLVDRMTDAGGFALGMRASSMLRAV